MSTYDKNSSSTPSESVKQPIFDSSGMLIRPAATDAPSAAGDRGVTGSTRLPPMGRRPGER